MESNENQMSVSASAEEIDVEDRIEKLEKQLQNINAFRSTQLTDMQTKLDELEKKVKQCIPTVVDIPNELKVIKLNLKQLNNDTENQKRQFNAAKLSQIDNTEKGLLR
jgi:predicted  nucleic acid-binding Zn-ribbon protein